MWDTLLLPLLLLSRPAIAANAAVAVLPFNQPSLEEQYSIDNTTAPSDLELKFIKRQSNGCATGYSNCATLGAAGICCRTSEVCQQDSGGNVACCPTQASCTGTIKPVTTGAGGVATVGTTSGTITVTGSTSTATSTADSNGLTSTTSGGIVFVGQATGAASTGSQQASGASRSYVSNPYYPYPYIPTTYANAAACSSAYTTCHADFSSCSSYLAGDPGAHGVTVNVPGGGGTTVAASVAPTTYASDFASSVCASLSSTACYGLVVEACGNFGAGSVTGAAARCTGLGYAAGVGVGVAMGVMGYR